MVYCTYNHTLYGVLYIQSYNCMVLYGYLYIITLAKLFLNNLSMHRLDCLPQFIRMVTSLFTCQQELLEW